MGEFSLRPSDPRPLDAGQLTHDPAGHTGYPPAGYPPAGYPPAGYPPGGYGSPQYGMNPYGQSPPQASAHAVTDGLLQILARRWTTVAAVTVLTLLSALLYLLLASPVYTSTAKLRVEPLGQQLIGPGVDASAGGAGVISNDFLATECDVVTSDPVLALALSRVADVRTFRGLARPLDYLKAHIDASVARKGQTIDVSFPSRYPVDADRIVTAVVESYQTFEADNWKSKVKQSFDLLNTGKEKQQQELDEKTQRMLQLAQQYGITSATDPDKNPAQEQVLGLSDALTKAHLETISAKNACDEAGRSILGQPDKLAAVAEAEKQTAYAANPSAQLTALQSELLREEAQLGDALRTYMPGHPIVRTIQGRIDQLNISCIAAAQQWYQSAQSAEQALQQSLDDAQKIAIQQEANAAEYSRLQADVTQLKRMDDVVDERMKEVDLVRGAGATNITVLDPAGISAPPDPQKGRTLGIALVLGAIGGLGIACARDWQDDRLRTPDAVQLTLGAPVLGSVPIIAGAFTAADRGQIVHHDPASEAAESYRTLRTALQFGLPARTKTLLVTSAVAGEGKSTLISNLAIAIAQAGKHVLIIDGDCRSPMQHRLFGLKDLAGLTTVLDGSDPLQDAIQHTDIEHLDVLPCGPVPASPAETLNDPAFADHLNDLADKYDLVLIDSPPVTAVADARIIAASADATLLVIRPTTSTRKQAIHARDGLRSVGARLVGVAINAIPKNTAFPSGPVGGYPARGTASVRSPASPQLSGPQFRTAL